MSILTIGKDERFNNYIPSSHIDKVKALSDAKDESTDELTQSGVSVINSSHGRCARLVRDRKDSLEIKALKTQTNEDYFYSLLEGSF